MGKPSRSRRAAKGTHPTNLVVVKWADVDVLMVPLIRWFNHFPEVQTLFCCQGEPAPRWKGGASLKPVPTTDQPYLGFTCTSPLRLMEILKMLGSCATVEVSFSLDIPLLRYTARFFNQQCLRLISDDLKEWES